MGLRQEMPGSYDAWRLMDGRENEPDEETILRHKTRRLLESLAGCKDCKHCEQYDDGRYYCTATGVDDIDPEGDFCDDFDDGTDWAEDYQWNRGWYEGYRRRI